MMRMAILLLIVANIVLFLWLHAPKSPERTVVTLPDPEVGRLLLASEAENKPREPTGDGSVDRAVVEPSSEPEPAAEKVQHEPAQPVLVEQVPEPSTEPVLVDGSARSPAVTPKTQDVASADAAALDKQPETVETRVGVDLEAPTNITEIDSAALDTASATDDVVSEARPLTSGGAIDKTTSSPAVGAEPVGDDLPSADAEPAVAIVKAAPGGGTRNDGGCGRSGRRPYVNSCGSGQA